MHETEQVAEKHKHKTNDVAAEAFREDTLDLQGRVKPTSRQKVTQDTCPS